ncbi:Aspartic proteinase nepenthesin-2 [Panicum miliaceum]|uniref:Aspartic proteinase nepenthesin-2 n=1 Tax=Panicum miliaceum TaxID=4540 RepID=A0A3L6SA98_PANMI|nr:Aspartic proteinase nepenthesin-2 [Panicum miliaceum]
MAAISLLVAALALAASLDALVPVPVAMAGQPRSRLKAASGTTPLGSKVYACRVGASSSGMEAILGLGWRGAQSLQGFSYSVSSNGKISVWPPPARGGGRRSTGTGTGTVALLSDPRNYPDLYYVNVIGIEVGEDLQQVPFPQGALDLRQDGSGGGVFLSTTMPLTLLNGRVYDSLIQTLKASMPAASIITRSELSPRQLCYRSGTQTPTITLVLDGGAATMKLPAENCWYKQPSDGSACLATLVILQSAHKPPPSFRIILQYTKKASNLQCLIVYILETLIPMLKYEHVN